MQRSLWILAVLWELGWHSASALVTFEKVSDVMYDATPVVTSQMTLAMCVKSCLDEENCRAVSFSVPPMSCSQFSTTANSTNLISKVNAYYLEKINLETDAVMSVACSARLWALERFPQKAYLYDLSPSANNTVKVKDGVASRADCYESCLKEFDFTCQASQYNFTTQQCTLLSIDRRSDLRLFQTDSQSDYTENLCVPSAQRCGNSYTFQRYQDVAFPAFFFDKTVPADSAASCSRLCLSEPDFICRSFLYQSQSQGCILSHNDRLSVSVVPTLPRIYAAVLGRPLTEYYEFTCLPEGRRCPTFSGLTRFSSFELDRPFQLNDPISLQQCEDFCLENRTTPCGYLTYFSGNSTCTVAPGVRPGSGNPRGYIGNDADFLQNTCGSATGTQTLSVSGEAFSSSGSDDIVISTPPRHPPPTSHANLTTLTSSLASPTPASLSTMSRPISSHASPNDDGKNTATTVTSSQTTPLSKSANGSVSVAGHSALSSASMTSSRTTPTGVSISSVAVTSSRNDTSLLLTASLAGLLKKQVFNTSSNEADLKGGVAPGSRAGQRPAGENSGTCRYTRTTGRIVNAHVSTAVQDVALDACEELCEASISCLSFSYSEAHRQCLMSTANLGKVPGMIDTATGDGYMFYEKSTECTDIRFECRDGQILIAVSMDKPFHGRLFIEGSPSPDCSARFDGQKNFTWPVPLSAEPCGTVYDGNGEFANTVTLQHHEVLVTKNDRRYRVNCKYDLGIINVTSSAFTVMSPVQTSYITSNITLTSLPPNLTIGITDLLGNQLQSAVLGDTLMFSIAVPENGSYGIAAKNCYAFGAKENERMQLTDDTGITELTGCFAMTNSLMITLAVFVALFMILSVVLLMWQSAYTDAQHRKMRCRTFSGTKCQP
ncbi:hypothetical protein BV898_06435 [Hypsibius exemplaris]|uniref:Uncharacterized protein n=1 Tax=Hypsibius exemplaris TaxID=2072580 RepID=A0A1W0WWV0_HYPEX|nr:hypothetical protein BV898_06435 [Hypsibius exemplaris]